MTARGGIRAAFVAGLGLARTLDSSAEPSSPCLCWDGTGDVLGPLGELEGAGLAPEGGGRGCGEESRCPEI